MGSGLRGVLGVLGIIVTVLAALNVYGDFSEVEAMARAVAEPEGRDTAFLSQVSRSPLSQRYVFVVKGEPSFVVTCSRGLILLGEYTCRKE